MLELVDDTLEFKQGWKKFFDSRHAKYNSTVFRTRIAIPAITILDVRGFQPLFDETLVKKHYGFGPAIPRHDMVGNIVPTVFENDERHTSQKAFVLELIHRETSRLIPVLTATLQPYLQKWATAQAPFDWGADADAILSNTLFDWLLGAHPAASDVALWIANVLSPVPWDLPVFHASEAALAARDRILHAIQAAPKFQAAASLAFEMAGLGKDETAKQILFYLCFNAWAGLQGAWLSLMGELSLNPDVQARIAAEAQSSAPNGFDFSAVSFADIARMPTLRGAVSEAMRLHGPVPFAYGEAIQDFVIHSTTGDYAVRQGEMLMGVFLMAGRDPYVFSEPDRFDPGRYSDPTAVQGLLWANGPGDAAPAPTNKMCAGRDVVNLILQLLALGVVSNWEWKLQEKPTWSDVKMIQANAPEQKLVVTSFRHRTIVRAGAGGAS